MVNYKQIFCLMIFDPFGDATFHKFNKPILVFICFSWPCISLYRTVRYEMFILLLIGLEKDKISSTFAF